MLCALDHVLRFPFACCIATKCMQTPVAQICSNHYLLPHRYEELKGFGTEKAVKDAGKLRQEGKNYLVQVSLTPVVCWYTYRHCCFKLLS